MIGFPNWGDLAYVVDQHHLRPSLMAYRIPLPTPPSGPRPGPYEEYRAQGDFRQDGYPFNAGPYFAPYSYPQAPQLPTTLPEGTLLHKGFYDLLSMIPTPSPSRLIWGASAAEKPGLAGPRYEQIRPGVPPANGPAARQVSPPSSRTGVSVGQFPSNPEGSTNQQRHGSVIGSMSAKIAAVPVRHEEPRRASKQEKPSSKTTRSIRRFSKSPYPYILGPECNQLKEVEAREGWLQIQIQVIAILEAVSQADNPLSPAGNVEEQG
ncbi:hypothetical protein B0H13DRAFT_1892730 [Mycena leptocephala]|nr:hypothetical protein B0H13DRAFT_1892730 [Mycena leptocephala]